MDLLNRQQVKYVFHPPRYSKLAAPILTWLASAESKDVTGRIFEASGSVLAIAEGWHRGPSVEPVEDPTTLGPIVHDLVTRARLNAGMAGQDVAPLDGEQRTGPLAGLTLHEIQRPRHRLRQRPGRGQTARTPLGQNRLGNALRGTHVTEGAQ